MTSTRSTSANGDSSLRHALVLLTLVWAGCQSADSVPDPAPEPEGPTCSSWEEHGYVWDEANAVCVDPSITIDQACDDDFGTHSSCTFFESAALKVKLDGTFSDGWGASACWDGLGHQVSDKLGYYSFVYPDSGLSWTWTFAPDGGTLVAREYWYFSNGNWTCCEGQYEDIVVVGDVSAIDCPVRTAYAPSDFQ